MKYYKPIIVALLVTYIRSIETAHLNGIRAGLGDDRRSSLFVNRIGQCKGYEDLPVYIPDCRIAQLNATHYVTSGFLVFRKDFAGNLTGSVWIEQCNSTGHCKPFTRPIIFPDACGYLEAVDPAIVSIQNHFDPSFRCPFRTGIYRFNDGITDSVVFL